MVNKREGTTQKGIRFSKWMLDTIQRIADDKGLTFTDVVVDLLRQELEVMGYTMGKYYGIGREAEKVEASTLGKKESDPVIDERNKGVKIINRNSAMSTISVDNRKI